MDTANMTIAELHAAIEAACAEANRQYVARMDTTDIDGLVDVLIAEFDAR